MSRWISIIDYAAKYDTSPSTIRRKIKNKSLRFRLDRGKYLILDPDDDEETPISYNHEHHKEHHTENTQPTINAEELINFAEKSIATISNLHQDLLDEKEKRLFLQDQMVKQLREEVSELRMLVAVLEDNNKEMSNDTLV